MFAYNQLGQKVTLADHIPLKQGLRQLSSSLNGCVQKARRPYSIKTRIKTPNWVIVIIRCVHSQTIFH